MSKNIVTKEDNCEGCHNCVRHCPVNANIVYLKNDNVKVNVNYERCIECGKCIDVCEHDARDYLDDTEDFFKALQEGKRITLLAAPSIRLNFPDYKKLFGYLKELGVKVVYDVSFGADITTWGYLKAIQKYKLDSIIAQPCPAVVNYIEKLKPELTDCLSPVHSPMLCAAIYVKKYLKDENELAVLSPCIAKKGEFESTNNIIRYNVTYRNLKKHLEEKKISLDQYKEVDFSDIACALGCLYSRPGGLRECVHHVLPNAWVRQVEGQETAYKYLDSYSERVHNNKPVPLLVDILNCQHGCNIGTAAVINQEIIDDIDYTMNQMKEMKATEKVKTGIFKTVDRTEWLNNYFDEHLKLEDFIRTYNKSLKAKELLEPTDEEYDDIFTKLHKTDEESRHVNCTACGYPTCKELAKAIYNDLSIVQSCVNYARGEVGEISRKNEEIQHLLAEMEKIDAQRIDVASHRICEKFSRNLRKTFKADFV